MNEGRLGGTAVKRLPSAQGVILALWDRAPHGALCLVGSLLLLFPLPLPPAHALSLAHSLSLSQINNIFKKIRSKFSKE